MLHPRDIVVLVGVHTQQLAWTYRGVAEQLGLTPSQVHDSLKRADQSGLFWPRARVLVPQAFLDFAIHGLRYSFPAQAGDEVVGIPTAHSAPPLSSTILSRVAFVWPTPLGATRGRALEPLDGSVVPAARSSQHLYELLALLDALRAGDPRERHLAASYLRERLALKDNDNKSSFFQGLQFLKG